MTQKTEKTHAAFKYAKVYNEDGTFIDVLDFVGTARQFIAFVNNYEYEQNYKYSIKLLDIK